MIERAVKVPGFARIAQQMQQSREEAHRNADRPLSETAIFAVERLKTDA
jgi:hypothetical protein